MRWSFLLLVLVSPLLLPAQNSLPPIGMWREHLPYHSAIDVTASARKVYCATPFSLFTVDLASNETERISKISGLSETGISTIKYDALSGMLLVAYSNSNIDVIDSKGIHNLPDLKRENTSGDKNIYHIFPDDSLWYLSTGLGVIVVDAYRQEIKDSWIIGNNGNFVKTNTFAKNNDFFYAATEEGLKRINTTNANPGNFRNWQVVSGSNGLSASPCKSVVTLQNKTITLQNDSLFVENGGQWSLFFSNRVSIVSINASEDKLFVCERKPVGSQVVVLRADGSTERVIQRNGVTDFPSNAISLNNVYYIADRYDGLSSWTGSSYESYKLNSPEDVASGALTVYNGIFYAAAGTVNDSWNYQYNRNGIYKLADGSWTNFNQFNFPSLDSMMDFITVAVDPMDQSVWGGSYGGGLLHIKSNNQFETFKQNSPIEQTVGDPGSYRVSGLAFDSNNNLWLSNFGSNHQLHVLKKNGGWKSFSVPFLLNDNAVGQIVIDQESQKWITSPMGNGLLVFNDNNTIDNSGDDRWKLLKMGTGLGNLPSNNVLCIAKDRSGFIWVGTSDGVAVIQCPNEIFRSGCEAIWPVIKDGNFANYLFKGQEVRSIAVDGGDRKWMATPSGAWLLNADGDKVMEHFTEENSALLSNDVKSIAIDGSTGEVFMATAKGICSYRGTATIAEETKNKLLVFPNPVPPSFNGNIGIRGVPENSIVKITEANGRLVYQTRATGGQAIWNGKDYNGRPVASGIYLVIADDDNKQKKVVTKIVFISR